MKNEDYAGFWLRFLAYIIDGAVLSLLGIGVGQLLFLISTPDGLIPLMTAALFWLYFAFMESSEYQATVGKIALGLIVVDEDGKPVSFARATGRYFGKILSAIILGIGFLMIAFTKKKQGLHDIVSGCLVVKK